MNTFNDLPFTIFEEYLLRDDSVAYPMDSFRQLRFRGTLDRERFTQSLEEMTRRHPLLACRAKKRWWTPRWKPMDLPVNLVWKTAEPEDFNESGFPFAQPIDLYREPGFRVQVLEAGDKSRTDVLLQFHHSVSDGIGEMQILHDLLVDYAIRVGAVPDDTPVRPLNPDLLKIRGCYGWGLGGYLKNFLHVFRMANQLMYRSPKPFLETPSIPSNTAAETYPHVRFRQFSEDETREYIQQSKQAGVTLNDLLLRDVFLAMDRFRVQHGKDFPQGWTRINVPINIRRPEHQQMPAANAVSYLFLDRNKNDFMSDPAFLLQGIHAEMETLKTHDLRYVLLLSLKICKYLLGGIQSILVSKRCRCACVVSNLGRILFDLPLEKDSENRWKIGDLILENVDAAPPIRPKTQFAISALTYAGKLRICIRYDTRFMTVINVDDFLKCIQENAE